MRKSSLYLLVLATLFIIISCGQKDQPELTAINPGLYEVNFDVKYAGQMIILKQRVRYNSDGTYEATNFQNDTAVEELKGNYKVENKELISFDTEHRLITQEGTWSKTKDIAKVSVRKIKKDGYQYYFKFPTDQSREQYRGLGLTEGWKTYNRISD